MVSYGDYKDIKKTNFRNKYHLKSTPQPFSCYLSPLKGYPQAKRQQGSECMVRAPCADAIRITEIVVQAWLYKQSDGRCDVVLQPQTSTYRPLCIMGTGKLIRFWFVGGRFS